MRRRLDRWAPPPADVLAGRTVLVTGPTSGLGRQVTDELAALGARVVLVGPQRGAADRASATRSSLGTALTAFPIVVADMGSLASVRAGR